MNEPAGHRSFLARVVDAAAEITRSLPPAFLGLLFVNVIFLAMIFLLLDRAAEHRADLINHILTACAAVMEHAK